MKLIFKFAYFASFLSTHYLIAQQKLSLEQAIQISNQQSPYIKQQQFNIQSTQAELKTARMLPNFEFNTQLLQLTNSKLHTNPEYFSTYNQQLWFQLTTPVKIFGQRKLGVQIAKGNIVAAEENVNEYKRNFYQEVGQKWLEVWYVLQDIKILRYEKADIDSLIQTLPPSEDEQNSKNELIRSQKLLIEYDLKLRNAQKNFKNGLNDLNLMLGSNSIIEIDDSISFQKYNIPPNLEELKNIALENRSDLKVAEENTFISEKQQNLAKRNALGQPIVGWVYNPQNTIDYQGLFLTYKFPIWDRNQGEIQKSKVLLQKDKEQVSLIEKQILIEAENTWNDYLLALENVNEVQKVLDIAIRDLNETKLLYLKRETDFLDFLEAERSLYETEILNLDTKLELYRVLIRVLTIANVLR